MSLFTKIYILLEILFSNNIIKTIAKILFFLSVGWGIGFLSIFVFPQLGAIFVTIFLGFSFLIYVFKSFFGLL